MQHLDNWLKAQQQEKLVAETGPLEDEKSREGQCADYTQEHRTK